MIKPNINRAGKYTSSTVTDEGAVIICWTIIQTITSFTHVKIFHWKKNYMKHSLIISPYSLSYSLGQFLPNIFVSLPHKKLQYLNTSNIFQVIMFYAFFSSLSLTSVNIINSLVLLPLPSQKQGKPQPRSNLFDWLLHIYI